MGVYDDLAAEEVQRNQANGSAVGMSLSLASDRNPDTEAAFQRIAARTGMPVASLRVDNAANAKKQELLQQAQDTTWEAPATAQFLSNPENADVSHDDINNLTGLEKTIAQFLSPTRDFLRNVGKSLTDAPMIPIRTGRGLNNAIAGTMAALSFGNLSTKDVQDMIPLVGTSGYDSAEAYWKPIIAKAQTYLATPEPQTAMEQINAAGAQGIGGAIKLLPAMGFGVAGMAAQSGLESYDASGDPVKAVVDAAKSATAMKLMGLNKGMPVMKSVGWVSGVSGVESFVTTLAQTGDVKSALGEGIKSAVQMATMDVMNRGIMPHPGAVYDAISEQGRKAGLPDHITDTLAQLSQQTYDHQSAVNEYNTQRSQTLLEQAGKIAGDSALNQRMTDKFEGLVKDIKDTYGVEDAHIPVEKFDELFQNAGLDPAQVANTLMSDPNRYHEAKATGSDVVIPLEELITRFSGLPQYGDLAKNAALGVGGISAADSDLFNAERDTRVKQFVLQAEKAVTDEAPTRQVYNDIYTKLKDAGRPDDVAKWEALLQANRQRTRATARGTGEDGTAHDAWSVYQERPDEIVNQSLEKYQPAEGELNQATPDTPEFKKWFGESKVVDDGGSPLVVYHGTKKPNFETFSGGKAGQGAGRQAGGAGFYFTNVNESANLYTKDARTGDEKGAVMPVYLDIRNPFHAKSWPLEQDATKKEAKAFTDKLKAEGYDGVVINHGAGVKEYVAFSPDQIKSALGNRGTFDPNDPNILHQAKPTDNRGSIRLGADKFTISLFKDADLSTFLHESSHQFLEEMATDAQRDDVSAQLKEDFGSIIKWMGVSSWEEVQRDHKEQWAKAFEDYLRTGKAPSLELQPAFQRFKGWLGEVYRTWKTYFNDSKLNPEISGVMDRMLASEDEINQVRQVQDYKQLFATAEDAGMTEAGFTAYLKEGAEAGEKAKENLLRQLITQMDRERTKAWKEETKRISAEVTDEASQMPVYKAMKALFTGKDFDGTDFPIKIDRQSLVDSYGEDFVKKLPKGFGRIYAKEGGWHPDEVAEMFGFDSGEQMLREISEAPRLKEYVKTETENRMKEIHGDMMSDGSITEKAMEIIHNEKQGEILRAELKAIRKKQREVKPFVDAANKDAKAEAQQSKKEADYNARWKDAEAKLAVAIERGAKQAEIDDLRAQEQKAKADAQQGRKLIKDVIPPAEFFKSMAAATMAGKKDRDITPFIYSRAEAKAAREAFEAVSKGDWEAAAEAKYRQLLNHYLFKEAAATKTEVGKIYDFFKKVSDRRWLGKNVGKADQGMLSQVQDILARYEFIKTSNVALDNRLAEALERFQEEYGRDIPVDERLLHGNDPRNYRDITIDELRAVHDTIKTILTAAKKVNEVMNDAGAIALDEAQTQTAESIKENKVTDAPHYQTRSSMTALQKTGKMITGLFDGLKRFERNVFERYDGGSDGPMHQFIWNRLMDGKSKYMDLMMELLPDLLEHIDNMPKEQKRQVNDPTGIEIMSLKKSFSKSELIGFALNMGCESNLDKMMRGGFYDAAAEANRPLSMEAINEIKDKLSEQDWQLVQHVWDQLAKLKPHMAELEKRWNGIEPVWVEIRPVETKYGTFDGGYYPMVGAPEGSKIGERMLNNQEEFSLKQFADSFSSSATKRGHLKERTTAAYAVNLDWQSIVTRHLNDVITDIAFREPVFHANRLLTGEQTIESSDPEQGVLKVAPVKAAIIKKYGLDEFRNIGKWLEGVVSYNSTGGGPDAKSLERVLAFTRSRATAMHIAYRLDNAISESITGHFLQAWQRVDMKYILHGALAATVNNPGESWQFVRDNSEYYQHLDQNVNQSFTEAMNELSGNHSVAANITRFGMELKAYCYKAQTTATFLSAYKQAMETMYQDLPEDEAHAKASRYADKVIRTTNDAGSSMDLSAWERSPIGRNVTQWMGPVIINLNNYIHAVNESRNLMDTAQATGKAAITGLATATPMIMRVLIGNYLANAIVFPLMKGKSPSLDDDKEAWVTWIIAKLATEWAAGMPFIREGAGFLESKMLGEFHRMGSLPVAQMVEDAVKLPYDAIRYAKGEAEGKTVAKDALNVGGWVFGLPTSQIGVTGQYLYDVMSGNYKPKYPFSPVKDILYPRPREK